MNTLIRLPLIFIETKGAQQGPPSMGPSHPQQQRERTYQPPPGFTAAPTNIPNIRRGNEFQERVVPQQASPRANFQRSTEDVKPSPSNMMSSFNSNKGYSLVWDAKNGNTDEKPQRRARVCFSPF